MSTHRVAVEHIRHLASGPVLTGGRRGDTLVDTDDGIRLVPAAEVFTAGVRRMLLCRVDLLDEAGGLGRTVSEHVRAEGGRIAAELNALLAEAAE
jgi:hypothetical protein